MGTTLVTANGIEITIVIGIVTGIEIGTGTRTETGDSVSTMVSIETGGITMTAVVSDATCDAPFDFAT